MDSICQNLQNHALQIVVQNTPSSGDPSEENVGLESLCEDLIQRIFAALLPQDVIRVSLASKALKSSFDVLMRKIRMDGYFLTTARSFTKFTTTSTFLVDFFTRDLNSDLDSDGYSYTDTDTERGLQKQLIVIDVKGKFHKQMKPRTQKTLAASNGLYWVLRGDQHFICNPSCNSELGFRVEPGNHQRNIYAMHFDTDSCSCILVAGVRNRGNLNVHIYEIAGQEPHGFNADLRILWTVTIQNAPGSVLSHGVYSRGSFIWIVSDRGDFLLGPRNLKCIILEVEEVPSLQLIDLPRCQCESDCSWSIKGSNDDVTFMHLTHRPYTHLGTPIKVDSWSLCKIRGEAGNQYSWRPVMFPCGRVLENLIKDKNEYFYEISKDGFVMFFGKDEESEFAVDLYDRQGRLAYSFNQEMLARMLNMDLGSKSLHCNYVWPCEFNTTWWPFCFNNIGLA